MNISASQWSSSGCESGWTQYLDHSSLPEYQLNRVGGIDDYGGKGARIHEQEEEDLSLVSDASSGPSYYHEDDEDDNGCSFNSSSASKLAGKSKNKKKAKEHSRHGRGQQSNLDDTASSPALSYPKDDTARFRNEDSMDNLMNYSQGFSATQFEGKSAFKKHFGFFKSSFGEKPASKEPGGFHGRNRK
ncbi:hypothetical protein ACB092_10G180200 [Castanea dentata]